MVECALFACAHYAISTYCFSGSGAVTFKTAPNFEAAADAGRDNAYDIIVTATDLSGGMDDQAVALTVTDVVETITGTSGRDPLKGGVGADILLGLADSDTITGGAGDDTLDGGAAVDFMSSGAWAKRTAWMAVRGMVV